MVADNFNNMVGTFHSQHKFPSRERGRTSHAKDERGLHGDRLLTFLFSSNRPAPRKNAFVPEDSTDNKSTDGIPRNVVVGGLDGSSGANDFHDLIDVNASRSPS